MMCSHLARFFLWWEGRHGRPWDPMLSGMDEADEFLVEAREMGLTAVSMGTAVRMYLRAWYRNNLPPPEAVVVRPDLARMVPPVLTPEEARALVRYLATRPRGRYWHVYWRTLAVVLFGLRTGLDLVEVLDFYAGPDELERGVIVIKSGDGKTERLIHEDLVRVLSAWSTRVAALGVGPVVYGRELPRKDALARSLRQAAKEVLPGRADLAYTSLKQTFFYDAYEAGVPRPVIGYFLGALPVSESSAVREALARLPSLLPEDFDSETR
jgi:integrase